MGTLLEINGLKKYYPIRSKKLLNRTVEYVKAVDDVSFTIEEGRPWGLLAIRLRQINHRPFGNSLD